MPESKATVSGDFSDLIKGADSAAKKVAELGLAFSGIKVAAKGFDVATTAVGGLVTGLGKIGLAASGIETIGKSTASMGMALLKGNANLEMTTISFKTLLGSASAANDMIKQLTQFAATTPFNLPGLEASTQKLLAFGFQAKDIVPMMTSMGDAIAALGGTQANLDSLVYVMGQMHSEAHINAGDIMQMTNLGIPALQMLADHYKVTTGEMQNMISKGLVPGTAAVDIFTTGLEKKYGGMMAAQSATFSGMISNLQDWATATTITLTKPFFEPAKKALAAFLAFVQSPAGVAAINRLAAYIQEGVDRMTAAFVLFEPKIRPTFERLLQLAQVVRAQMTPGILSLIPLLFQFWQRIEPVALALFKFYQAIQPLSIALAGLRGYLTGGLPGALAALQGHFAMISGYVKIALNAALLEFQRFGPAVLTWVVNTAVMVANRAVVLGEALIHWVAPYAGRLIGELINLAGRVLTWIVGYAPVIANQVLVWAEAIASWVIPAIPKVLTALLQLALGVVAWIEREAPMITGMFLTWASAAMSWILPAIPGVISTLAQLGLAILTWVEGEAPVLLNAFLGWTEILAGWVIPAIPGVIRSLEQLGAVIVNWAINRLPILLGQVILGIGQGFGVNLRPVVNDLMLIFYSLVNAIQSTVLPAFEGMTGYLETRGIPLFNRLSAFIAGTVIPTLASLAAFAMTTLVPIFMTAADLLGRIFGPALTLIGSIIRTELLPALTGMWQKFEAKNLTSVQTLATRFGQDLAGGVALAVARFKEILPHLQSFYDKIAPIAATVWEVYSAISPLSIVIDTLSGFLNGGVQGGLDAFGAHMGKIGGLFSTIVPQIITALSTAIPQILDWISQQAPVIFETLGKWADSFGKLAEKVMPPLMKALGKVIGGLFDWVTANGPGILNKLGEWAGKFGEWAKSVIPILLNKLGDLINALFKWVGDKAPDILSALGEWAGLFVEWAAQLITKLFPEFNKMVGKIYDWIGDQVPGIANKLGEWAGAFLKWVVTDFLPGWITTGFKIETTILKFIGAMVLKIAGAVLGWAGAFLGWIPGVVAALPGHLWDIITGIGSWIGGVAGNIVQIAGNIGGAIITGIVQTIHDAPGKIWDAVTGVLGSGAINIIKGVVQAVANFFVDVVNTPINLINTVVNAIRNIDFPLVGKILSWLPTIPTLGYLSFAKGTKNAPGGLSLVGEQGMELVRLSADKLILATRPMLLNLPKGAQVFNNQQTMNMLPSPASPQQISNMYSTSNANRSWDYSTQNSNNNSHNTTHQYYINGQQQGGQMPFGQQMRWYGAK